ncbi:MAG: hypothetical protein KZQ81_05065 [Candidatus Thiodiazotropha sp. (ex Rostrolucina anterorostrata)]|nr:hypothetical protein [Candidatus Thiodiazotropha sp. (ex Rostrolucina anterorostrata)]
MDDTNEQSTGSGSRDYPVWFVLLLVLLWLGGFGVMLLFGFFAFITLPGQFWPHGLWNLLVTVAEGWVLFHAVRHYFRGNRPLSVPLLWAAVAAIAVPLVASGGCALMADSIRIAG